MKPFFKFLKHVSFPSIFHLDSFSFLPSFSIHKLLEGVDKIIISLILVLILLTSFFPHNKNLSFPLKHRKLSNFVLLLSFFFSLFESSPYSNGSLNKQKADISQESEEKKVGDCPAYLVLQQRIS